MRLVAGDAWRCPIPLPRPLALGRAVSTAREYVVLRLEAEDGSVGVATGYSRGTPLLEATETLFRALDPAIGWAPADQQADLQARYMQGWSSMVRAASLIDIALWNLHGGFGSGASPAQAVPLMAVAGYFADTRPLAETRAETLRLLDDGASIVKVLVPGIDHEMDRTIFAEIAAVVDGRARLGVDLHGTCRTVDDARRAAETFAALGAEFLEDPFPGHPIRDLAQYADSGALPLAVGEDLAELSVMRELAEIAEFLRVDATASGGYTFANAALSSAAENGARVLPHVFPAVHAPLAAVSDLVEAIEVIPAYVGAEPIDAILETSSADPLAPLAFDWQAVESHSRAHWSHTVV